MPAAQAAITAFNNVLTASLPQRQKEVHDQWHQDHVFLAFTREMGGFQTDIVEPSIQVPLNIVKDPTVASRGIWASIPLTDVEHLRAAEFTPTVIDGATTVNRFEMTSGGPEKVLDLWDQRQRNTVLSMEDEFNTQSLNGVGAGNDLGGLPLIISGTPTTGTVGGINRATAGNEYWRNQVQASVGGFAANGLTALRNLRNSVNTGSIRRQTKLNVTTSAVFNAYEATQVSNIRYQGPLSDVIGDAALRTLMFYDEPVIWDNAVGSGLWYMLNFENIMFKAAPEFQFTFDQPILSEAQYSMSAKIALYGNWVTNNPRRLGVATGIT
jgi:hypothetical protein